MYHNEMRLALFHEALSLVPRLYVMPSHLVMRSRMRPQCKDDRTLKPQDMGM